MSQTILVTGGAGYIGTHAVKALQQKGFQVVVLDNLVYGHRDLVELTLKAKLVVGDVCDRAFLAQVFETYAIDAVMHFAAFAYVGESVQKPAKYYWNNVAGTLTLLQAMLDANVDKLVFSSTCATYGTVDSVPVPEDHPQKPINPYGRSKWMIEQMLPDFDVAYGLKSVCFRYFNAAGADPSGQLGEDHEPETHLIPSVLQTAMGLREAVSILGTDYPTPDGTCIRDFIHVADLAQAHVLGLAYLLAGGASDTFNLSNGSGFSVKEVIETAKAVTGQVIPVIEKPRRPGDPPVLVGSGHKASEILGWSPQHSGLNDIVSHAWRWHQYRHRLVSETAASPAAEAVGAFPATSPLVSVVIPAYNVAAFIARTLASVMTQTYRNLEILVVNDGSSDRTPEIVSAIAQQDARIRLLNQPNGGVASARNLGIQQARGEFIAPIDADDLWYPEAMAKLVSRLQACGPEVGIVYAWSMDIDAQDQPTGGFHAAKVRGHVHRTLICHNFLGNASSTLIRKACLDQVGGYNPQLRALKAQGCEDWDLYLRLAERYDFEVVPQVLVGYRKVVSGMSGDFSQMARSQRLMLAAVQRNHPEIPAFLYRLSRSSFYLYLAHQCDIVGNYCASLNWLWQAIKVDPVTPFGRLGMYVLLAKGLSQKLTGTFPQGQALAQSPSMLAQSLKLKNEPLATSLELCASPADQDATSISPTTANCPKINRSKIWLKVFVGKALHRSLLWV